MSKWIKCSEQAPPYIADVLLGNKYFVEQGFLRFDGFYYLTKDIDTPYTQDELAHWMPLPEPPEE